MDYKITILLLTAINLNFLLASPPNRNDEIEQKHILHIPADAGVQTLQQMLKSKTEDDNEDDNIIDIPIDVENIEQLEELFIDGQQRIMTEKQKSSDEEFDISGEMEKSSRQSYSEVSSSIPARLEMSPASKLYAAPEEEVKVRYCSANV